MNGICAKCRFWSRDYKDAGSCSSGKLQYASRPLKDGLAYQDYEDYSASMLTGPNFGCVHFEAKGKPRSKPAQE